MIQSHIKKVIVVGAGPVGLLTALLLGQKGIPVDVLEANAGVNNSPRGLAYGPAAVRVLHRAGILEKVIESGFVAGSISWRKPDGKFIIGFDRLDTSLEGLPHTVILPVGTLSALLADEVQNYPSITVHWNHRVTGIGQDNGKAWAQVEETLPGTVKTMVADFVIGCDGGTSAVRKALFGGSFPGYTWPMQLIAVNASIDFDKLGFSDAQWIVHPEHWFVIARIDSSQLWRIVYGETSGLSIDEIRTRLTEKFREHLPSNPEPEEYTLQSVMPYSVHQRCAEKMRVGRVLLAGDAAHLNNPMQVGGLGLTTGVADVGSLIDCLCGIHNGAASLNILEKYSEIRRQIFLNNTDVISTTNFKRIMQDAEEIAERDPFFQLLAQAKTDPHIAASLAKHDLSIGFDMSQFYDIPSDD
ncbi:uncharacterized protein Z519_12554 [Cladophialophora bantiana CBS 173.52]|uniref:FAD-binding domain-containing protein n=1 Tax=Cladophialophora bantiana (strain ATCC 10958 / CBS 173.52 / CDC B-1940 / NIH 8579) TaxID=1442370 RepID=A0A0D2H0G3_CLAB1|nr:uncharacterized protein Z519_12554 [Cladophialophora bantiana CBS 173.52]KIW86768.1 hypothetical protein Z519_12554 [Cladophialophora bantiana CBS 173.52]